MIPFWDPGVTANPGSVQSLLPEYENAPWPDQLSPFNTILMAGIRAPGLAVLKGGRAKRFSAEATPGDAGQIFNFYGYDYSQFSIKLHLWTVKQWEWLQRWLPVISPPPTAAVTPRAVKVDHPVLRLNKVTDAYVIHVGFPDVDKEGLMTLDIECVEYLSPQIALGAGTVRGSAVTTVLPDGRRITITVPNPPVIPGTQPK